MSAEEDDYNEKYASQKNDVLNAMLCMVKPTFRMTISPKKKAL